MFVIKMSKMLCRGHMFLGILRIIDDGAFNKKKNREKQMKQFLQSKK